MKRKYDEIKVDDESVHRIFKSTNKKLPQVATASVVKWFACWPLVPEFAGSNPAEAIGFFSV
jgi:hypothetical protein